MYVYEFYMEIKFEWVIFFFFKCSSKRSDEEKHELTYFTL